MDNYVLRLKKNAVLCDYVQDTINYVIRDQIIDSCQSNELRKNPEGEESYSDQNPGNITSVETCRSTLQQNRSTAEESTRSVSTGKRGLFLQR